MYGPKQKAANDRWRKRNRGQWNEYQRKYRAGLTSQHKSKWRRNHIVNKRAFIANLKNAPCTDCGGEFPAVCMDFDHVRGKKVDSISHMYDRSNAAILREIKKCELVCANCHRIRTARRRK